MKRNKFYIAGLIVLLLGLGTILENCGGSKEKDKSDRSLTEILEENDFAAANKYLSKINRKGSYEICNKYLPAATEILKAEASYLMDQDDPDAETLFMLCINDVSSNIGNSQPTIGHFEGDNNYDTEKYIDQVTPYNACLLSIIKEAAIKNKPEFAKKVLKLMKPNYICEKQLIPGKDTGYVSSYTYDYSKDDSQIEEAQKIISELEAQ